MGQIFAALGPTWLAAFAVNLVLVFALVAVLRRSLPSFQPSVGVVVALSLIWTLHGAASTVTGLKQAERLANVRAETANAAANQAAAPTDRTPEQLRGDFLNTVDAIAVQPQSLTPENKAAIFRQFAALFPRGDQDRLEYARNIIAAYQCQASVFEDALATIKAKKIVKSQLQGQCEQASGGFFGRQTMIPADVAKANAEMMSKLAKGKGDKALPSEENLRLAYDQQIKRIEALQKLFQ